MTRKRRIFSFLQLTLSILEKGFLHLNMHITNDCLAMCVELSCESVVCWNMYIYIYIYIGILLLIETLQSQFELVGIVSIGLYTLCTRIGLVQAFF